MTTLRDPNPHGPPPKGSEIEAAMLANDTDRVIQLGLHAAIRYAHVSDWESASQALTLALRAAGLDADYGGGVVRADVTMTIRLQRNPGTPGIRHA